MIRERRGKIPEIAVVLIFLLLAWGAGSFCTRGALVKAAGKIGFADTQVSMTKNKTVQLEFIHPSGKVTWKTSNRKIATVSSTGRVKAKRTGECIISALYRGKTYKCRVHVYQSNVEWMPQMLRDKFKVKKNKGRLVLAGSSTIEYWESAAKDLSPVDVVNVGIAGSKIEDWLCLYKKLIVKYEPEAVLLFIGGNNINGREDSDSGYEAAQKICRLLSLLRAELPGVPIYYVSIYPTEKRWDVWKESAASNTYVQAYCKLDKDMYFINFARYLLKENGSLRKSYFRTDQLHLNAKGYRLWNQVVSRRLKKDLQ